MTTFEEELGRALIYGCPFCEDIDGETWNQFELKAIGYYYVDLTLDCRVRYTEREAFYDRLALYCSNSDCRAELWTAESGWVDQLKGVVESD